MSAPAVKHFALLQKKKGMSTEAFRDHYENKHVPLIHSIAPYYTTYIRNYVEENSKLHPAGTIASFDVVTECWFKTVEDCQKFLDAIRVKENEDKIAADEEKFIDRSTIQFFTVTPYSREDK